MLFIEELKGKIKNISILTMFCLGFAFTPVMVSAQGEYEFEGAGTAEYSEKEVEEFVDANLKAMQIQQEYEKEMISKIEEQDLDVDRFNQLLMAQHMDQNIDASESELNSFQKAMKDVTDLQMKMESELQEEIEGSIGVEKFQSMAQDYQQNPEFQERVDKKIQK